MPHPHRVWYFPTMTVACSSVWLSDPSLSLSRSWSGIASWESAKGMPMTELTRDPFFRGQMVKVQDYNVMSSLSRVFYHISTKSRKIPKIVKIICVSGDIAHKFERQKVKRSSGRLTPWTKISHNFWTGRSTDFELDERIQDDDPQHRHSRWPQRSEIKVITSRRQFDACLPTGRQRKVAEVPKCVERLSVRRVT